MLMRILKNQEDLIELRIKNFELWILNYGF